ncbi:ATP-binding cassette domain-containing protein [Komagataeibacter intermedius]|uniref:ABC transporter related protein n=2 Tax=Komagataeibacter intermedius TaxID=66229 RepID=A0A0N0MEV7_9PROT|nr:ATP-binding cassette domain-containing protein [Komagataeibacter intermedius]KPH86906.1 ABC transporter related protein [Komagataeibacter intermedius AF2]MCF3635434.1 ATP-binding cassette domain-containing protein [Komagataeibacter intermedius]GAN87523.1 ABC transporter hemin import HmuV [Komagataeibacter intermedius TF2]GBQ71286.1 ferrichrome transporter ATP-binding protein [Komagataeibacter intermedius NRIC 0521]
MGLELRHATWRQGGREILRDMTLSLRRGQVTAIIGPNGAGKSSLLHLASGLCPPTGGDVLLDGRPIAAMSPRYLAAHRAMLTQESEGAGQFLVRQMVMMGAGMAAHGPDMARQAALADALVRQVGLERFAGRQMMTLSGGERQRAHLARVLMQLEVAMACGTAPGFLLLDEPISAQDPAHQALVLQLARRHADQGGGVAIILHDLNWAAACADHLVVIRQGAVHAQGPPGSVLTQDLACTVFGLTAGCVHLHGATGRPFILPHEILHKEKDPCISP